MESGRVEILGDDEKDTLRLRIKELCDKLAQLEPETLHCMMGVTVTRDPTPDDPDNCIVNVYAAGGDRDIAQMFACIARVVQSGMVEGHMPVDHSKEVKH
jgi:hypothetical protein